MDRLFEYIARAGVAPSSRRRERAKNEIHPDEIDDLFRACGSSIDVGSS
jgi:hypothetical protein